MMEKVLICLALLSMTMVACVERGSESTSTQESSVVVTIGHEAGKSWTDGEVGYLASPVNAATYKQTTVLVLSDVIAKGKEVTVLPLGVAVLEEQGNTNHYVVAVPANHEDQSLMISSFEELITKYSSAKWIIEQYLLSRNGMGSAKLVTWHDQDYVVTKLWKD